jgi:outer membrane protein assembly factor BamB
MLPVEYRGKLLTVDREGKVVKAVKLADDDFGGLAYADGYFYVALTNGAEILKVRAESGEIVGRFPLASPAGGLEYDHDRNVLIGQFYVGHPHLAVIDPKSGQTLETLWSDESAMGLAKVDGDLLCTWASGWDPGSFSELRLLDPKTGKVRSRIRLQGVHSSLAATHESDGKPAFMALVTVDSASGETVIRRYSYLGESKWGAH